MTLALKRFSITVLNTTIMGDSIPELRERFQSHRDLGGYGASEIGAQFVVIRDFKRVGVLSYNGRYVEDTSHNSDVTDEQIKDLLIEADAKHDRALHVDPVDSTALVKWGGIVASCEVALGRRRSKAKGGKARARARCVEIIKGAR